MRTERKVSEEKQTRKVKQAKEVRELVRKVKGVSVNFLKKK